MNKTSTVGRRIIGALVGLLAGGLAVGALFLLLFYPHDNEHSESAPLLFIFFGGMGFLIGAILGAAGGATMMQKLAKQRSSFWRALLGAVTGPLAVVPVLVLSAGVPGIARGAAIVIVPTLIVAGAVLGSGWKVKPANATGSSS